MKKGAQPRELIGCTTHIPREFKYCYHFIPCIAKQIVEGLSYLHANDITHRDLKSTNILVDNKHYTVDPSTWKNLPVQIRLSDFGLSWSNIMAPTSAFKSHTSSIDVRTKPTWLQKF